jgi:ketosteroid isomerase-like protein
MSEDNVAVVARMYKAFHAGEAEEALGHFDPDVLVDASRARPDLSVGKGHEYVNATVTSWVSTWEEWREEIEEMRDLGSRVLVLSVQRGRGKGSGAPVEARYAMFYDVHAGKIVSMRMYGDVAEALKAAGADHG